MLTKKDKRDLEVMLTKAIQKLMKPIIKKLKQISVGS